MSDNILVVYAFIVLLPLIPAVLLFSVMRSSATVNGPLFGLQVSLGGSFGGYFVLFMVLALHFKELPQYEKWHVRGTFSVADGDGVPEIKIVPQPPEVQINSGHFDVDVPIVKGLAPPLLVFDAGKGYPAHTVYLDDIESSPYHPHIEKKSGYAKSIRLDEIKFEKNQAARVVQAQPIGGAQ